MLYPLPRLRVAIVVLVLAAVALRRRSPYLPRAAELPIDVERTGQGRR